MTTIERLERVSLREVWPHEAYDFSQWLQDNLDVLNEALGLNLASAEAEKAAGEFNIDLLAEDESGRPVIIENQLESSDHDHLGKVVTYLSSIGAEIAIWIVAKPRSEHIKAISWLNEASSGSFYMVKVEAVRIGNSPPAPLLTQIVGPSAESREVGKTKRELSERQKLRFDFWSGLLEKARERTKLHANISPSRDSWVATGAGLSGLSYNYVVRQHDARVELYIDRGSESENKAMFDQLLAHREAIETAYDEELTWKRLEGKRACRIHKDTNVGGYRDDNWDEIHEKLIDMMVRFEAALRPYVKQLKI